MSTGRIQIKQESNFKYILRLFNTNVDGKQKIPFAIRSVRGIGRRLAIMVTKKAGLDVNARAGDISEEQLEKIVEIVNNPTNYSIPEWFLNRKRDPREGNYTQMIANAIETKLREDLEKMKRMKLHKGLRHYYGLRVRGQHTCSTGRRGKIVGVEKKK